MAFCLIGRVLAVSSIIVGMAMGQIAKPIAKSADGMEYGDTTPLPRGVSLRFLPNVGKALGSPPTVLVGSAKAYSSDAVGKIEEIFKGIKATVPHDQASGKSQFYFRDSAGVTGFDLDGGRVVRINRFKTNWPTAEASQLRSNYAALAATHPQPHFDQIQNRLAFWLDAVDWYLTMHGSGLRQDFLTAMRNHKVLIGMDEQQAAAIMDGYQRTESDVTASGRTIIWSQHKNAPSRGGFVGSATDFANQLQTSILSDHAASGWDEEILSIKIETGKVVSVTDNRPQ